MPQAKDKDWLNGYKNKTPIYVVRNAVLGCNLKNDKMISVRFQGKPFHITVILFYAPTSNAEETEVEQFYEDIQDLLELTPQKENDLCSFPRQTIQYHNNPSLCPNQ